jgi:hypothetical protein
MTSSAAVQPPLPASGLNKSCHYGTPDVREDPVAFDAKRHLSFSHPSSILTMQDLKLEPTELSEVATTEPFPFLSHEGVLQHRRELFSQDVLDNCLHHTRPGSIQLRGMAPRYAPFIHQFWHSPEVLKIVSRIAGIDLIPAMDYEISHTNVQLGPGGIDAVRNTPVEPPVASNEAIRSFEANKSKETAVTDQTKPVIEWHKDSHPWVCVVMLSDARHMSGGETELMKGDGTTLKVKAPQMVHCLSTDDCFLANSEVGMCGIVAGSLYHPHCCTRDQHVRARHNRDVFPSP